MCERLNVLFVAASENNLFPVLKELHHGGFYPVWQWVKTADAFRTALADCFWNAIIADYNFSDFDTFGILTIVHQSQLNIPFIVISDTAGERLAVEMIKAGAHDYLMKDNLGLLPEILQNEIENARERSSHKQNRSKLQKAEGKSRTVCNIAERTKTLMMTQSAVDLAADCVFIIRPDGHFHYVNNTACSKLGYPRDQLLTLSIIDIYPTIASEDWIKIWQTIKQQLAIIIESQNQSRCGEIFPVEVTANYLEFDGDAYALAFVRDITNRKQAEMQLRLTNEKLVRATRLKNEFLANMSHELHTPLNAILGMAESLREQAFGEIHEQQIKPLQMIQRNGNHLLELINDILDVAKIESDQLELDIIPTAIEPICRDSLAVIMQQAYRKSIQVATNLPTDLPDVPVDKRRIRQVLIHLLSNAVKFTPKGGHINLEMSLHSRSTVSTSIVCKREKQNESKEQSLLGVTPTADYRTDLAFQKRRADIKTFVRIAISDTGIGIASEDISTLFEPFIQIDSDLNRKYSGTGLGLALVKRIVELHGGVVGVKSNFGNGSCFTVDLPCALTIPTASATSLQALSKPEGNRATPLRSLLILLADNKNANSITIMSYLRAKGYCVQIAATSQEVINLAQIVVPDLILIDSHLQDMYTLDVIRQIRCESNLIDVPIVALI
ncbi:MAG: ATP-binding protein, partial [Cyanobacteria bacterium P01_H01_bin.105]